MKLKKTTLLFTILFILGLIFAGQVLYYYGVEKPMDSADNTKISLLIKKGDTAGDVGAKLEDQELIRSNIIFELYIRQKNLADKIIAGRFYLDKTMSIQQIVMTITDASKAETIITIQEGLTVKNIDEKLVAMDLIKEGDFIKSVRSFDKYDEYPFLDKEKLQTLDIPLEGYLFPDTYFLDSSDFDGEQLIIKCLDNFDNKIEEKPENLHEIITMASIIEREVRTDQDRPIISGILWKRYNNNWHIGADATLLYITDDKEISQEDLEIDSPYNTRKVVGIPPGPIGNPGLESVKASTHPEESPYWYYLTTLDTGEVIYAVTNEEQNINRAKYLY